MLVSGGVVVKVFWDYCFTIMHCELLRVRFTTVFNPSFRPRVIVYTQNCSILFAQEFAPSRIIVLPRLYRLKLHIKPKGCTWD